MNRKEIDDLIRFDTRFSPVAEELIIEEHEGNKSYRLPSEYGGLICRYYEDANTARAYCLIPYSSGVVIIYDKTNHSYFTAVLGEDDGYWFLVDYSCPMQYKLEFIACISEALSIFNNNFREK